MKLICVPFAGALKRNFDGFAACFDDTRDITVLEYPGHGSRYREAFAADFDSLSEDMAEQVIKTAAGDDYVLFGYSMGSIVSYEMTVRNLIPKPKLLVEASHRPPNIEWESKTYVHLDDHTFFSKIKLLGAMDEMDESLLDNNVYRRMYFNPIREDYRLISTYKTNNKKICGVPALCFYSPKDVPDDEMDQWKMFFDDDIEIIPLGDNHFFIFEHAEEMAEMIKQKI
ncbi:MAG: thioesterase [Clostridiales bacterium]|nr:thioesterase [Clostridiales bacterium]